MFGSENYNVITTNELSFLIINGGCGISNCYGICFLYFIKILIYNKAFRSIINIRPCNV